MQTVNYFRTVENIYANMLPALNSNWLITPGFLNGSGSLCILDSSKVNSIIYNWADYLSWSRSTFPLDITPFFKPLFFYWSLDATTDINEDGRKCLSSRSFGDRCPQLLFHWWESANLNYERSWQLKYKTGWHHTTTFSGFDTDRHHLGFKCVDLNLRNLNYIWSRCNARPS